MVLTKAPAKNPAGEHPAIRSYVLRQGRITKAQAKAWQDHAQKFVIAPTAQALAAAFPRLSSAQPAPPAPLVVEIGSGYGTALAAMARDNPQTNFLAYEVHYPGVGALIKLLHDNAIENARVVHADAITAIPQMLPDGGITRFNLFFPDPWQKKRHHKRRIARPEVITLLLQKLAAGGGIHFATDWQPYAQAAREAFAAFDELTPATPPARARTLYEERAKKAGREVSDLFFIKR